MTSNCNKNGQYYKQNNDDGNVESFRLLAIFLEKCIMPGKNDIILFTIWQNI